MKKIISLVLLLSIIIFTGVGSYAENNNSSSSSISEYDLLKEYSNKSYSELLEMGLNEGQAKDMLNIDEKVITKINELISYSNEELLNQGYNNKQIKSLREFETSKSVDKNIKPNNQELLNKDVSLDAIPMGIFGDVNMDLYQYTVWEDEVWFQYSWSWTGKPLILNIDAIGFAWDSGFRVSGDVIDAYVTYVDGNNFGEVKMSRDKFDVNPGAGWGHEFHMTSGPSHTAPAWAKGGWGTFYATNPNNKNSIQVVWSYGHATIDITGASLRISPSAIGFGFGVERMYQNDKIFYF